MYGGPEYFTTEGLLQVADAYGIILIYPQVSGIGPEQEDRTSCWNVGWYTNALESTSDGYLTYENLQARTLKAILDAVLV